MKKWLIELSKKNQLFRKVLRFGILAKNRIIYLMYFFRPINEKIVLFEAFMGRKYADSPKAIYEYLLKSEEYRDYHFIWFFKDCAEYSYIANNDRTSIVEFNSSKYYKCYATAKYWITNSRISNAILKKRDQVYIQCWHGTPLKRLGFDIHKGGNNAMNSFYEIKYKYQTDAKKYTFMVSPSKFCTEKFISAFNLKEMGRENIIIEEGYPRNDFLSNYTNTEIEGIKNKLRIPKDKKVILYAPTWRDNQHESGVGYVYSNKVDFNFLKDSLEKEYVILFRAHYFVANQFDFQKYKGFIYDVSNVDDINALYVVSDLLITDYSSVMFDFAILKRPMIFYMYDLEEYRDELRGFYISLEDLPGTIVKTEEELIEEIRKSKSWEINKKYDNFNKKFNYLDDGNATARVIQKVFTK